MNKKYLFLLALASCSLFCGKNNPRKTYPDETRKILSQVLANLHFKEIKSAYKSTLDELKKHIEAEDCSIKRLRELEAICAEYRAIVKKEQDKRDASLKVICLRV